MSKKILGIALLVVGIGLSLYLIPQGNRTEMNFADLGWEHPAFAATGSHGSAPSLGCWDCHGSHPSTSSVPQASGMSCFDCHSVQ